MIFDKEFLDHIRMVICSKPKFIYRLSPHRSILLICDKNNIPLVKYCMVNRSFSQLSDGEDLNNYSELLYTFEIKRSHH